MEASSGRGCRSTLVSAARSSKSVTGFADLLSTFVGNLGIGVDESGSLVRVEFLGSGDRENFERFGDWSWDEDRCAVARQQLEQYFAGERREFDLVLEPKGTEFQRRV